MSRIQAILFCRINLALIFLSCAPLLAQKSEISFNHFSTKEGLSNFTVLAIAQDAQDFMWFGTLDGLNRYDGQTFKVYRSDPANSNSIGSNYINALCYTSDSTLFVGTTNGLYSYDFKYDHFVSINPSNGILSLDGSSNFRSFLEDGEYLWMGSNAGVMRYNLKTKKFESISNGSQLFEARSVYGIVKAVDGTVWFGTDKGLYKYNNGFFEHVFLEKYGPDASINARAILIDSQGRVWWGNDNMEKGLIIYDPRTKKHIELSEETGTIPRNRVRSLYSHTDGTIWVGTREGLAIVDELTLESQIHVYDRNTTWSVSQNSIWPIYRDRHGVVWIGTYSGGVNYYNPESQKILHYADRGNNDQYINYNIVSTIYKGSDNKLWVGTENRGVNTFNDKKQRFELLQKQDDENSLVHNNIKDIIEDKYQRKFIATNYGISIYNPKTFNFFNISEEMTARGNLHFHTLHSLSEDSNGNIWLGSIGPQGRYLMYDIEQDTIVHYEYDGEDFPGVRSPTANALVFDPSTEIMWSGGFSGLSGIHVNSKKHITTNEFKSSAASLQGVAVIDMTLDSKGFLWIATSGRGLFVMDTRTYELRNLGLADGLFEKSFNSIICDDQENIWVTENTELVRLRPITKLNEEIAVVERFGAEEGFPVQQYYRRSVFKDRDGWLYFGGDNGFVKFDPKKMHNRVIHPKVAITEVLVNGENLLVSDESAEQAMNVTALKKIKLSSSQSSFSVNFIAPNYLNTKNTWYQYRLSGVHNDWQGLGTSNSINFTGLKPGSYELMLQASSEPNDFNSTYRSLYITLDPPFWQTPLAYLSYSIMVLIAMYLFFIITRKWERLSQNLRFEHLEREKEHEFNQQRIRFFTDISHELRTPLTLILAPLEKIVTSNFGNARIKNQLMLMLRNGERMLQLINQLLDLRKLETGHMQLQAAKGDIVHFIQEVSLSFRELASGKQIDFTVVADQESMDAWFDRDKLEIILFNLLSNAIKYTPEKGNISISINKSRNDNSKRSDVGKVNIEITNSGMGIAPDQLEHVFERFYSGKMDKIQQRASSGVGLEIVKKLVDLHNGEIRAQSKYDENGKDGYASFIISLKLGKDHLDEECLLKDYRSSEDIKNYLKPLAGVINAEEEHEPDESMVQDENTEKILVVEDNPEVRQLVAGIFRNEYNVIVAEDGNEGLALAKSKIPDLVISDIMMPGIDGIELCRELKSHVLTSHIPVVLLTARTAVTFKYEGLETGADDYIVKPFSVEDLKLRVVNLLKQRSLLKERYSQKGGLLIPDEITITSVDEKLLQRTIDYITENIADSDLTIEKISEEVGMSRAHFYRKIKALTNLSASEFMRKIKMEHAANLIRTNKLNISEVRYMVGMSDADYFRKCFKENFGMTPKEYLDKYLVSQ